MDTNPAPVLDEPEDHDRGLQFDLSNLVGRRRLLGLLAGGVGAVTLTACGLVRSRGDTGTGSSGGGSGTGATTTSTANTTSTTSATSTSSSSGGTLTETPEETSGPYPGDGSNGVNVLTESGIVRSDIRSSFGASTTTAPGIPFTITLKVVDQAGAAQAGKAVYLWHCDRDGKYSMYSAPNENYLRGVQETATDGTVTFTSIYPACYDGRWPHVHYEVYPSLAAATSASSKEATSQIALPEDVCTVVYATSGYEQSATNLARVGLTTDMVFADSWQTELGTVTGDVSNGYTCTLTCVL
jgi:protocatechuate 3,4-dioxygenase beta subunit